MNTDPEAADERRRRREAAHQRRQESRCDDLRHAASVLIPDQGLSVTFTQLAAQAGLSRGVAAGLYPSVAALAVDLVCSTWRKLIETTAPTPDTTPEDFLARLIEVLRAGKAAHRVWQVIQCGLTPRLHQTMAEAEAFLALCIGGALRKICPAIPREDATEIFHGRCPMDTIRPAAWREGTKARGSASGLRWGLEAPDPHSLRH